MAAVSALLAICSSLLWGTSDFVAGLKAKTMPAADALQASIIEATRWAADGGTRPIPVSARGRRS